MGGRRCFFFLNLLLLQEETREEAVWFPDHNREQQTQRAAEVRALMEIATGDGDHMWTLSPAEAKPVLYDKPQAAATTITHTAFFW